MDEQFQPERAFFEGSDYDRFVAARSKMRAMTTILGRFIVLVSLGVVGVMLLLPRSSSLGIDWVKASALFAIGAAAVVGLIHAALTYLEPRGAEMRRSSPLDMMFLGWELARLRRGRMARLEPPAPVSKDELQQIVDSLTARVRAESVAEIATDIHAELVDRVKRHSIDQNFEKMTSRLQRETADLARRGNLNLVLGMITTMCGLGVLGYAVLTAPTGSSYPDLLGHFAPRFSLALLIEVFAYFFLKLYKESLGGIKYFQNELTNVESRQVALEAALDGGTPELRTLVVQALCSTERNFILNKDQTTIELERERLSKDTTLGLAEQMRQLLRREKIKED